MNIPQELIQAIHKDNLILFIGAGLSYQLKNKKNQELKDWKNMVHQILLHLEEEKLEVDDLLYMSNKGKRSAIRLLELIEEDPDLSKSIIIDFLKEFLDLHPDNDFGLHKKLYRLSRKIITTNYDRAFELAEDNLRKNTAYKGRNFELTTHKDPYKPLLFKLHGCYEGADSMVLFPSQYDTLYKKPGQESEHPLFVLKSIILNKSVLFIGCGMGDHQINNLFAEVKRLQGDYNQPHFIITKEGLDSSLNFLKPILIKDYHEIPVVLDQLLEEKEKASQQESAETMKLKQQLVEVEAKLEASNKKGLKQQEKIERLALKHFKKGVEYQLSDELEKAIEEYEEVIELTPGDASAFYNWGTALSDLGQLNSDESLYRQAFKKYEEATRIKNDDHEAFYNWGNALYHLGQLNSNESLYRQAFEKYEEATRIKNDDHQAFNNWGTALYHLGQLNSDESLYRQAFEKYEEATKIKNDKHEAFNNWGTALSDLGQLNSDESLYQLAIEKHQLAIKWGGSSYNLACLYATYQKDQEKAFQYLRQSLKDRSIQAAYVQEDEDWAAYREDPAFIDLLAEYME